MNERRSPYQGLIPYGEDDSEFFFGRERDTRLIVANLFSAPLTLLYGPSGVGKTSVLQAGVLHHLRQRDDVLVVPFRSWQPDPLTGAANALSRIESSLAAEVSAFGISDNDEAPATLADVLEQAGRRLRRRIMVVFDQVEEYFLYRLPDDPFERELAAAITQLDVPVSFLISIREDSLAMLDVFEGRIPELFDNYLRIEHLDRRGAQAAIEKPLARFNELHSTEVRAEPGLVDAVLEEVVAGRVRFEPGRGSVQPTDRKEGAERFETPYLQLVMTRLWDEEQRAGSSVLRRETLVRLGGAQRIVRTHLDGAMSTLGSRERKLAAEAFRYLVTPSNTKIAYSVSDLSYIAKVPETRLAPVLERLSRGDVRILRPVTPSSDRPRADAYEIYHDVLAPAVLDWRARYYQQRRSRRMRVAFGAIALAAVAGLAVGWSQTRSSTRTDAKLAGAEEVISQQQVSAQSLIGILRGHRGQVTSADFNPDGKLILTASTDGTAILWRASTGQVRSVFRAEVALNDAAFSPDGELFVAAADDGTARIWSVPGRTTLKVLLGDTGPMNSAAFSPDGRLILTASGNAVLWSARVGESVLTLPSPSGAIQDANFSPDGKLVVTAGQDGSARIWDVVAGKSLAVFRGHTGPLNSADFSPDAERVVTAGEDGLIRIWDVVTGSALATWRIPGAAYDATFSPDGKLVVTAGKNGSALISSAVDGRRFAVLRGHAGPVNSAAFSPDGELLATASGDGTARLWNLAPTNRQIVVAAARVALENEGKIHYSQSRPAAVRVRLPNLPTKLDTSSFVVWCYFQAGAADPSGQKYTGFGSIDVHLDDRGRRTTEPRPGDVVFYGPRNAPTHVGIYVGGGRVISQGSEAGPRLAPLRYRPDLAEIRTYLP